LALSGPVDSEPLTAFVPDQSPEAEQEVAFSLNHVRVDEPPDVSELGLAWMVTTGGNALTVTVTD